MTIATPESVQKERISEAVVYGRSEMEPGREAWELLQQVWMTEGAGRIILPVDPVELCERIGLRALLDDELVPEISAILRKEPGFNDPTILLNPIDSHDRRRFVLAHVIGHYSRNLELQTDGPWEVVDGRDFFASDSGPDESYATEFAFELLMPRAVLNELDDTTGVASLAARFGVTGDVMSARLNRIGWRR